MLTAATLHIVSFLLGRLFLGKRRKKKEQRGCPQNKWACSYAAGEGHIEVLKWLSENGCPWDEDTCTQAISANQFEILRWARENGYPWDEDSCGSWQDRMGVPGLRILVQMLPIQDIWKLQWARENGCPLQNFVTQKRNYHREKFQISQEVFSGVLIYLESSQDISRDLSRGF